MRSAESFRWRRRPARLQSPAARALAYEMAVCVCNADGAVDDPEKKFLADLHQALQLDAATYG